MSGMIGRKDDTNGIAPLGQEVPDIITISGNLKVRIGLVNDDFVHPPGNCRVRTHTEITESVAPPLSLMGVLTRDFKVPTEQIGGVVTGQSKRFEVTIRPKHAEVTQIPPIDFVYFDPVREDYVRLQS